MNKYPRTYNFIFEKFTTFNKVNLTIVIEKFFMRNACYPIIFSCSFT